MTEDDSTNLGARVSAEARQRPVFKLLARAALALAQAELATAKRPELKREQPTMAEREPAE